MLKTFMYMKNYRRIMMIFAVFLTYISMYLIHNAYGSLCIIKTNDDKSTDGDIEAALYKVNNTNLFAVSNIFLCKFCSAFCVLSCTYYCLLLTSACIHNMLWFWNWAWLLSHCETHNYMWFSIKILESARK